MKRKSISQEREYEQPFRLRGAIHRILRRDKCHEEDQKR